MCQLDGRGVCRRMDTCVSMAESFCCSAETIITLLMGYTPIQSYKLKKKTTTTLISCLSRVFPWGSYLVLCIVNKWIRNSDKCFFPSQCEMKRACCQEEEVTDQLQIWLQLGDGAPANIPSFMLPTTPWATAPHQPGRLERVTQSHRTRKFCFFKH